MTAFVDTNILVRHLTGDPPAMAMRATAFLAGQPELYLADLIVAETVYVLESFYKAPRDQVDLFGAVASGSARASSGSMISPLHDVAPSRSQKAPMCPITLFV